MNHYEKLAVVLLRVLGCAATVFGLFGFAPYVIDFVRSKDPIYFATYGLYFLTYAAYAVAGLVLFALSKPLAALIARKF
jgi:hypothetical protein